MLKRVENNGMVLKAKNDGSGRKYGEISGTPQGRFELPTYWFAVRGLTFRNFIIINKLWLIKNPLLTKFWLLFSIIFALGR